MSLRWALLRLLLRQVLQRLLKSQTVGGRHFRKADNQETTGCLPFHTKQLPQGSPSCPLSSQHNRVLTGAMKSLLFPVPGGHPCSLARRAFCQRARTTLAVKSPEMLELATWVGEHTGLTLGVTLSEYSSTQLEGKLPSIRTSALPSLLERVTRFRSDWSVTTNTALISWSNQSRLRHLDRKLGQRGLLVPGAQMSCRTAMFLSHSYKHYEDMN